MRLLLLGLGFRGDVEPFAALGRGLAAAGHDVALAVSADRAGWVRENGLACETFGFDVQQAISPVSGQPWPEGAPGGHRAARKAVRATSPVIAADLERMVRPGDLVVSSALSFSAAESLARDRGCAHVTALFSPATRARQAFPGLPPRGGGLTALICGSLSAGLLGQLLRPAPRSLRARAGLGGEWIPRQLARAPHVPVLLAASPLVVPDEPDWGPRVRVTGWWALPAPDIAQAENVIPSQVRAFVMTGQRPVYLGFGGTPVCDPAETTRIICTAVRRAGVRAVVPRGPHRLGEDGVPADLDGQLMFTGDLPHAWLLPRCSAVVTHGGAGSAGAGLRSGVPSMAVPYSADQPYWGRRLYELGVGPEPIPRPQLTSERLAAALRDMLGNVRMRVRAARIGAQVAAEDGVAVAVGLLENRMAQLAAGPAGSAGGAAADFPG